MKIKNSQKSFSSKIRKEASDHLSDVHKVNYKYLVGKFSLLHMGCSGQNGLGSPDGQTRIIV